MELNFYKKEAPCLRRLNREVKEQEQTQEVRLGDSLPDIGRILGAWGQVIVRSKEWHGGMAGISGGVLVWVLYSGEGEEKIACVDGWIPFRFQWEIPDASRDGSLTVHPLLEAVDARAVSARRILIRTTVSVDGEAAVSQKIDTFVPGDLPEDIQVLRNTYPAVIPSEAGEKAFRVEETIPVPKDRPISRILRFHIQPELVDRKVVGGKVVFRGMLLLHLLYLTPEEELQTLDCEFPFSQYGDLEREYDDEATVTVIPILTAAEIDMSGEDGPVLKAGLTGQYKICSRVMLEVTEDAYSTNRELTADLQSLQVPMVLEDVSRTMSVEVRSEENVLKPVDLAFYPGCPRVYRDPSGVQITFRGIFRALCYDGENRLQGIDTGWEQTQTLPAAENCGSEALAVATGIPTAELGNGLSLTGGLLTHIRTAAVSDMQMVASLTPGEKKNPAPDRDSLILRRAEGQTLWQIAKAEGSAVDEICRLNGITPDNIPDGMLLIPVL